MQTKFKKMDKTIKRSRGFNYANILKCKLIIDEFYCENNSSLNKEVVDERIRYIEYYEKVTNNILFPSLVNLTFGIIIGSLFFSIGIIKEILIEFKENAINTVLKYMITNSELTSEQRDYIYSLMKDVIKEIYFYQLLIPLILVIGSLVYLWLIRKSYLSFSKKIELYEYEKIKLKDKMQCIERL